MKKDWLLSVTLITVIVTACQPAAPSSAVLMLKPGDQIDGMVLTTGAAEAPPLWAFCSSPRESNHATTLDCRIPLLPSLAIGHTFRVADEALQASDWSALKWELYVDGQPMDLEAFGTYHFILPTLSHSPSRVREVFRMMTAWDVVLTNLKPGEHTLRGLAQADALTYTWVVTFTVAAPSLSQR